MTIRNSAKFTQQQWTDYTKYVLSKETKYKHTLQRLYHGDWSVVGSMEPGQGLRLLHCAIGLHTDSYELLHASDETNTVEEVGDCLFYLCLMRAVVHPLSQESGYADTWISGFPGEPTDIGTSPAIQMIQLHKTTNEMLDRTRVIFYDKGTPIWNQAYSELWHRAYSILISYISHYLPQYTLASVIRFNRDKLDKRYAASATGQEWLDSREEN